MSNKNVQITILIAVVLLAITTIFLSFWDYSDASNAIGAAKYDYVDAEEGISIVSITFAGDEIRLPDKIDGKTVTEIGNSLFENNTTIKKVILPEGLLKIGERAFANCENLKEVVFNHNIIEIDNEAFKNCSSLASCVIPVSNVRIEESAFDIETEVSFTQSEVETSNNDESSMPNTSVPEVSEQETNIPETSTSETSIPETSVSEDTSQDDTSQSEDSQSQNDPLPTNDFIMMYQSDPEYASYPYGDYTVGSHGCGPACIATVIKNFTGADVTPATMADWSYQNGYYAGASGSYHALISAAAKNWGVSSTITYVHDKDQIRDSLENGKLLLVVMGPGEFTTKGHFLLLRGFTEDGMVLIGDTQSQKNTNKLWDFDFLYSELKASSPIWIFG